MYWLQSSCDFQGRLPSPLLPIYVHNIHKCKRASDTGTYDKEGR
jgi:peroxygenase